MATTYIKIATVTVGSGGATSMAFTSIPATYTDLKVVLSARSDISANWALIGVNGGADTASTLLHLLNNLGSPISQTYGSFRALLNGSTATASTFASSELYFPNYASASNKAMLGDGTQANNGSTVNQHLATFTWPFTAAITSLTFTVDGGTDKFVEHTSATLYGIKNS
jgi:hypothetical protein